jgi:hypothetical protein
MFLAKKLNKGSGSAAPEDKFNYVTMLLHGDGTNGAQNNTFVDGSTNNFSITRNGNTTQGSFSPYGSNWSNYFNGSTDYLTFPNDNAFAFGTGSYTIEFWINGPLNDDKFILGGRNAITVMHITTGGSGSTAGVLRYNGTSTIVSSNVITDNTWHHCAIVRNGSSNITLYVDGVSVGTGTDTSNYTQASGTWYVSRNDVGAGNYLNAYISNLRIVKGTAVYTSNFTPSTTPLTAISGTSLLTCQSNRFIDTSANNFTITPNGTPSVQRFNPFGTATAYSTSVIGGSGYFDGTGDYLTIPSTSAFNFGANNFTVEFWLRTNVATGNIINPTSSGNWALFLLGGTFYWNNAYDITNLFTVNATSIINNAWHHIAFVRSSGTIYVYFDGVLQTSNADPTVYTSAGSTWNIGSGNVGGFVGYICDMRINNGTAVYTSAFTPPTAPLTAITNTQLLCNMTNGAIIDNAMMNDLETVGNAQISTSVVKYGTGSLAFDGSGDSLVGPSNVNYAFGTGDFTVEGWFYQTADNTYPTAFEVGNHISSTGIVFITRNGGNAKIYSGGFFGSTATTLNAWNHIAWVRSSGVLQIYVNGTGGTSAAFTTNLTDSSWTVVGSTKSAGEAGYLYTGYIDDLRITKGYARYTANFTPPTAAFSNTGPV